MNSRWVFFKPWVAQNANQYAKVLERLTKPKIQMFALSPRKNRLFTKKELVMHRTF